VPAEVRNKNVIDKISQLNIRLRETIRETLLENHRKSNFLRIFPARGSETYDKYFVLPKPYHKMVHRCLYGQEIIPFPAGYPVP
jgi:hypothetical protein